MSGRGLYWTELASIVGIYAFGVLASLGVFGAIDGPIVLAWLASLGALLTWLLLPLQAMIIVAYNDSRGCGTTVALWLLTLPLGLAGVWLWWWLSMEG